MLEKRKIIEAGKHIFLWRKIYNNLCRSCKAKLVRGLGDIKKEGTETQVERMSYIREQFCESCKKIENRMVDNYEANR